MAIIGAVADDFTGTASAGTLLAQQGVKTGLFFDPETLENFESTNTLDAIYVSSGSRHLSPEKAYDQVNRATKSLQAMGVRYFSKKIDTTLRGGIGYEIDAMLDLLNNDTVAIMVTAMPQSKRICVGGYSLIDNVILTETPVANDVRTPVKESYVPSLLQKQTNRKIALVNITQVAESSEAAKQAMAEARENGAEIIIVDAITLEHLDNIAKACCKLNWNVLAVDPGAFTMKLAQHRNLTKKVTDKIVPKTNYNNEKTALFVVGTPNPSTRTQVDKLCKDCVSNKRITVSPTALLEGGKTAKTEIDKVTTRVVALFHEQERARSIVIESINNGNVLNLEEEDKKYGYEADESSRLINEGLAFITNAVLSTVGQDRVAGLILTGGDTMESICRKIGVTCIQALDNIIAQVDVGKIIGRYDGLPLIVKGGFCGTDEIATLMVERLFLESN